MGAPKPGSTVVFTPTVRWATTRSSAPATSCTVATDGNDGITTAT